MDVESFSEGILGSIVIPEGGVAGVGNAIAYIAETEADLEAAKAKGGAGARRGGARRGGAHMPACTLLAGRRPERRASEARGFWLAEEGWIAGGCRRQAADSRGHH